MNREAGAAEEVKKPVPLQEFWNRYAMPPKSRPSCLVCGRVPDQWPPAIQHLAIPSVIVCTPCTDAARGAK